MRPLARLRRPSAPMIVALLALFVALGGPAQAARLLDGGQISKNTVTTKQIRNGTLKPRDLSSKALGMLTATPNGSITARKLGTNAVSTRALAPGQRADRHGRRRHADRVGPRPNAVGADEIADNAVGQAEIRNNGVGASEIADDTIDGGEIIDGGLSMRDVARKIGDVPARRAGDPRARATRARRSRSARSGIDMRGAFVLASPTSTWPDALFYTVNGNGSADLVHGPGLQPRQRDRDRRGRLHVQLRRPRRV